MRRLCPSTSLKPDPGRPIVVVLFLVVVYRVYTLRFSYSLSFPPSLFSFTLTPSTSPSDSALVYRSTRYRARSFDYCFVKCDVKDSKITLRLASIVLAIKAVVLTPSLSVLSYNPFFFSLRLLIIGYHPVSAPF